MLSKFKTFGQIVLTVKNWFAVILVWFSPGKEALALFRNSYKVRVSKKTWSDFTRYVYFFCAFPDGEINNMEAKISYNKVDLTFDFSKRGPSVLGNIIEVFSQEIYEPFLKNFDLNNKIVIDVGGALGDTAVYFALKGAKMVYAFEPTPNFYNLACRNIKINNLEDKCKIFNAAVGKEKKDNNLDDQTFKDMFVNDPEVKEYGNDSGGVPMITIREIVEKFKLSDVFLKLDCEGYEYDIILNAPKDIIRKFEYIIMEYHYGFESLKKKLEENGFLVEYTKPNIAVINNRPDKYKKMEFGYLTARKID